MVSSFPPTTTYVLLLLLPSLLLAFPPEGVPGEEQEVINITDTQGLINLINITANINLINLTSKLPKDTVNRNTRLGWGFTKDQEVWYKKLLIVLAFICCGVIGGIAVTFVNVNLDLVQLNMFHTGFMGRKLQLREGTLVAKKDEKQKHQTAMMKVSKNGFGQKCKSKGCSKQEATSLDQILIVPVHSESPPRCSQRSLKNECPEWRDLDYSCEVGVLPSTFLEFYAQYDWSLYDGDKMSPEEILQRKNLLRQFKRWKERKRRNFRIVVTDRVKREMVGMEEKKNLDKKL